MQAKDIQATKKGNAVGFAADGKTVVVQYRTKRKAWYVSVEGDFGPSLTEARNQSFATLTEAKVYAASLCDDAATAEKKWW